MIIDPPITPFSPLAEIEAWLEKLSTYPQDEAAVQRAIAEVEIALTFTRSISRQLESRQIA